MRVKLLVTILLAVVVLLLVWSGTTHARSFDNHQPIQQQTISNTVYLPIIAKPPCTWVQPTAYVAVDRPIVRVGDWVTITGALFNECYHVGAPNGRIETSPEDLLDPPNAMNWHIADFLPNGAYATYTATLQAVQPGIVSVVALSVYEVHYPNGNAWWESSQSAPVVVRIVP